MECPIIHLGDKVVIIPQEEGEQMYGNIIVLMRVRKNQKWEQY